MDCWHVLWNGVQRPLLAKPSWFNLQEGLHALRLVHFAARSDQSETTEDGEIVGIRGE